MPAHRLTLLFDADDTLWDNNVHFERAIEAWLEVVADYGWPPEAARAELDRIEEANFTTGGVGTAGVRRPPPARHRAHRPAGSAARQPLPGSRRSSTRCRAAR